MMKSFVPILEEAGWENASQDIDRFAYRYVNTHNCLVIEVPKATRWLSLVGLNLETEDIYMFEFRCGEKVNALVAKIVEYQDEWTEEVNPKLIGELVGICPEAFVIVGDEEDDVLSLHPEMFLADEDLDEESKADRELMAEMEMTLMAGILGHFEQHMRLNEMGAAGDLPTQVKFWLGNKEHQLFVMCPADPEGQPEEGEEQPYFGAGRAFQLMDPEEFDPGLFHPTDYFKKHIVFSHAGPHYTRSEDGQKVYVYNIHELEGSNLQEFLIEAIR